MRLLLISGSHSRHLYVMQQLLQVDNPVGVIVMQREATVPDAPQTIDKADEAIFKQHFDIRRAVEDREYGKLVHEEVFQNFPILERSSENLNSSETAHFIQKCDPTACIIFASRNEIAASTSSAKSCTRLPKNPSNIQHTPGIACLNKSAIKAMNKVPANPATPK